MKTTTPSARFEARKPCSIELRISTLPPTTSPNTTPQAHGCWDAQSAGRRGNSGIPLTTHNRAAGHQKTWLALFVNASVVPGWYRLLSKQRRQYTRGSVAKGPVGIFDSGVGGLSVLREIHATLPAESIDYIADSANAPWGDKTADFVRERGLKLGRFLVDQGAKAIVIGSNTGTAGSAEALRSTLTVPVVGIEPGIKPAVAATRTGVVGAIVPALVGGSDRLASLLGRYGGEARVITQPVPGLVEFVEDADLNSPELRRLVEQYVAPLIAAGADTIVLGSTHYVFLKPVISDLFGPELKLIDTGAAVARQLGRVLEERGLTAPAGARAAERFWTSGDPERSKAVISALLGRPVEVEPLPAL